MVKPRQLFVCDFTTGLPPDAERIDLGAHHPSLPGLTRLSVHVDAGERVTAVDVDPGALHRGVEMLFPARDYRQSLSLANRHDWQSPITGELLIARLVESELGVEIPDRATWIRAALAEHFRALSLLAFCSFAVDRLHIPEFAPSEIIDELRTRNAELTGHRVHPMAVRLGGVAVDPSPDWVRREVETLARASQRAGQIEHALAESELGVGVATVTGAHIDAHGLSGPIAAASGVHDDLRRAQAPYDQLDGFLPTNDTRGDARARLVAFARGAQEAANLAVQAWQGLPEGPLAVTLPQVVKLPEGDAYAELEAPLGRQGVWLTSRGDRTPWRLRIRTPSFANVSAWSSVFPGMPMGDLATAIASLPYVTGDLAK